MIAITPEEERTIQKLGEVLREFRIVSKLRQRDLAHRIGISLPVIIEMEKGNGGRTALGTWIAALSAVGALSQLNNLLEGLEANPFERYEIKTKRKKRVRVKKKVWE